MRRHIMLTPDEPVTTRRRDDAEQFAGCRRQAADQRLVQRQASGGMPFALPALGGGINITPFVLILSGIYQVFIIEYRVLRCYDTDMGSSDKQGSKAMAIIVSVNNRVFDKGVKAAKSFGGKFDGATKTWTLNEQLVTAAKGGDTVNTLREWLGYRGLILVETEELVTCWECGAQRPINICTHDGNGYICRTCAQ